MRTLMMAACAALVMSAAAGAAHAQDNNCPVTTTTSIGPNGETITRREACGAVEITTTGGRTPATPPANTSGANRSSSTTTTWGNGASTRTRTETETTTTSSPGSTETRTRSTSTSVTRPDLSAPPVRASGPGWNAEFGGASNGHDNLGDFPQPPADFARIVLFDRANFRGRSIGVTQDTPNLAQRRFVGLASAARVQAGVWELCTEPNYAGTCVTTDTNLDLAAAGLDDSVASIRQVRR